MNAFKGRLSNAEACDIVHEALKKANIPCRVLPIGDGGSGTLFAVRSCLGGKEISLPATGPLGYPLKAKVLCLPSDESPTALFIESAEVCGHHLVPQKDRDPMRATSR